MIKTKVAKIETEKIDMKIIKDAVKIIKNGGVVIYPTETCYGIGGDATNVKTINRIYEIKKRGKNKPIPIIVSDLQMMKKYGLITNKIEYLVKKFMPGPLTIITRKRKNIPDALNPSGIAFRVSSHPVAAMIVKLYRKPITTTSANVSGQPPIYNIDEAIKTFENKVDMILDCGDLLKVKPSTYVDMKNDKGIIIREGVIKSKIILDELKKFRT